MNKNKSEASVVKRADSFTERIKTRIWQESASETNPYLAESVRIHGYDLVDLSASISFTDSIYLNIRGELPSENDKALLNAVLVALSNPGPRHGATRSVMNAAVSKTHVTHLLPIGLSIMGAEYDGAREVEKAVRFIKKNLNKPAKEVAGNCLQSDREIHLVAPGFGTAYGARNPIVSQLADQLSTHPGTNSAIHWGIEFSKHLIQKNAGWKLTGLAGACFVDLGFTSKESAGLFQLATAPGLLAHGLEMLTKPLTAMPFVDDADYHYTKDES